MTAPALVGVGLSFDRGGRTILDGASLSIGAGEIVALLGANGSGKTTLLRLLMGFLRPARGRVFLDGAPLEKLRRRAIAQKIAYVAQIHAAPFPYLVRDVVALGRLPAKSWLAAANARDEACVEDVLQPAAHFASGAPALYRDFRRRAAIGADRARPDAGRRNPGVRRADDRAGLRRAIAPDRAVAPIGRGGQGRAS